MTTGSGTQAQINVTPLIDVLLVLLIIFMAIAPRQSTGLEAQIPQVPLSEAAPPPGNLVVSILPDRSLQLNSQSVSRDQLQSLLRRALALQPDRVVFLQGANDLEYRDVAAILDDVRAVGASRVGLMTKR